MYRFCIKYGGVWITGFPPAWPKGYVLGVYAEGAYTAASIAAKILGTTADCLIVHSWNDQDPDGVQIPRERPKGWLFEPRGDSLDPK